MVFARSAEADGSMNTLLKHVFTLLGSGSGGGSEPYAQGSSEVVDVVRVNYVLNSIAEELENL